MIELSKINNRSLILCVDDRNKWKEVQNENKLDCNKNEILRKPINNIIDKSKEGRKVHFFNIKNICIVGEATILSEKRGIISFKSLLVYPNYELTPAYLRDHGVNIKIDRINGYKDFCSGRNSITKIDSDKINELGMSENK